MKARQRWLGVCALVLALGLSGAALGQSQEAAELKSVAGRAFYDQEKFSLALASFKEAFALHPSSRYLFNSAKACGRLGDEEGAIYYFERYLALNPVAEDRETVLADIEKARQALLAAGRIEVHLQVVPAGAAVVVPPEHSSEVALAPASLFVVPGSYLLEFVAEGFVEQRVTIDVAPDSPVLVTVEVSLEPPIVAPASGTGKPVEPGPAPLPWQWVMLGIGGAGVVAAGTGGYLWYDGWAGMGEANDAGGPDYTSSYRTARDRYVVGQWVTAAGAAVAAGGILGYYLWPHTVATPAPSLSLVPRDDGFVVGFGAVF
mgnify:FL=1